MNNMYKCVVVDDEPIAREIIESFIEKTPNLNLLGSFQNAVEVLNFEQKDNVDLYFLDINMPKVDGWEFLEKYKELPKDKRAQIIVVMLTTSLNANDKERALSNELISEFRNKPLTKEMLKDIEEKYFKKEGVVLN